MWEKCGEFLRGKSDIERELFQQEKYLSRNIYPRFSGIKAIKILPDEIDESLSYNKL